MNWPTWTSPDGRIRLINADCLDVLPHIEADCIVTDPPYGIAYESGMTGHNGGTALAGIVGDEDTSLRDSVLEQLADVPAIVFGSWKASRPKLCRAVLIWEKGDHVGMGDLSLPWKPNTEEIYVIGRGFAGHRGSSVLRFNAPVSWNSVHFGRTHPHEKPVDLMMELLRKCPSGAVLDPFAGSFATAVACARLDRECIAIETDPEHYATGVKRLRREYKRTELFDTQEAHCR
jgi:DNA modification methylase